MSKKSEGLETSRNASGESRTKPVSQWKRFCEAVDRHPVSPLLYITLVMVLVGYCVFGSMLHTSTVSAQIPEDGSAAAVAAVADASADAVTADEPAPASLDAGDILSPIMLQQAYAASVPSGKPLEIDETATMDLADEEVPLADVPDAMALEAPAEVYALVVNDEVVGYAETDNELYKILDEMAQPWITENTIRYEFVEDVAVTKAELPEGAEYDTEAIRETLSSLRTEEACYSVVAGDTFNNIARKKLGMDPDELSAMNPDIDVNHIYVGDQLVYQQAVPYISVLSMTTETRRVVDKSPVEYESTKDLYVGSTKLKTQGSDGLSVVTANVTYCNGVEQEREITATEVLEEPVPTIMYSGTTPRPATASKGYYIWPVSGHITSRFGYRTIFGGKDFHTGLDIACPYGTTIKAADGGKVIFAGWKGTYGKLVLIQHDNGNVTAYAHCSSILVSVGQKVYQGQAIAKVGKTGSATGYHCHFEVRVNGTRVNPLNYLS